MTKITAEIYEKDKERYTVVSGHVTGAPTCTFGNVQQWVGYDKKQKRFVRFTKSVFKKLIQQIENKPQV